MTRPMHPRLGVAFLVAASVALLWLVAAGGSVAQEHPEQRKEIKLRYATFDPLLDGPPPVPEELRAPESADAYIVQFVGPPTDRDRADLHALGVAVHFYLPEHAHVVRMDSQTRSIVEDRPFVRWVGPYHPAYKLEEALVERLTGPEPPPPGGEFEPRGAAAAGTTSAEGSQRYSIMVLQRGEEYQQAVTRRLEERGAKAEVPSEMGFRVVADLDDDHLRETAQMSEVLFIDVWSEPENDVDLARQMGGADFLETVAGYTGQGVRGEVMDTRLRTTHQDFQATPPIIHAGNSVPTAGCGGNGHGTCVYGIVFGDGSGNAQARGLLPDAQGIFASYGSVADRYAHTAELVDPTGTLRAVFQTNSWGDTQTTAYNTVSAEFDDILFINDILVTQSQSNTGNQNSRPQAWAKNVVSVGGIRHQNTVDVTDDSWTNGASVGPAADGRIKPDLSHFYDSIFTTTSTGDNAYGNFCCTSGATPLTAGHFGLLFQMWADGVFSGGPGVGADVFDSRPHAATAKALMINTASQYQFNGAAHDLTRTNQGWGRANVEALYEQARQHAWQLPVLVDESATLEPAGVHEYPLQVGAEDCAVKATLVYKDPMGNPASTEHRVNDLSLRLTSPGGTVFWGNNGLATGNWSTPGGTSNTVDTVENVFLPAAELGTWTVAVLGDEIVQDAHLATPATDATYALVVTSCAEVDAEVVDVSMVNPPDEIYVGDDVPVTVRAVVANNGLGGPSPANFDVTIDAVAPTDCSIVGADQIVLPVILDVGASAQVEAAFVVHCTEPSFHTFTFNAAIASTDPDVRDPDPANNTGMTDMTVGVVKQVVKDVSAIAFDIAGLRAVINPVEPGEPMVGSGALAAPWAGAGARPLPWAATTNPAPVVAACADLSGHLPQPGHGNWANPRAPITLVVPASASPATMIVDDLGCGSDDVNVDTTVTATVLDGGCHFGGGAATAITQAGSDVTGWNLQTSPTEFADALTLSDTGCTLRIDVEKEPSDIHYELIGNPQGSVEVRLVPARDGRMNGGGSVFASGGDRYTHGFNLHCDGSSPANLQVHWSGGNAFRLADPTAVLCFDDPALASGSPLAGFNTLLGNGLGRLNGTPGATVWFHFTDSGEPGAGVDLTELVIDGAPKVSGLLDSGNHQAHRLRGKVVPV